MDGKMWFVCTHCSAMFRADNNLCVGCGAPADVWKGREPIRFASTIPTGSASIVYASGNYVSTAQFVRVSDELSFIELNDTDIRNG